MRQHDAYQFLYSMKRLTVRQPRLILSEMVNDQERRHRTFTALVDPTRRAILAQ
jgi:hypothetical protein